MVIRVSSGQRPSRPQQRALLIAGHFLITDREQRAIRQFDRGRVAEVTVRSIVADDPIVVPSLAFVAAKGDSLAKGRLAIAISKDQCAGGMPHQMRRRAVEAKRLHGAPRPPAINGYSPGVAVSLKYNSRQSSVHKFGSPCRVIVARIAAAFASSQRIPK